MSRTSPTCSRLTCPHGVYAVLGNHDYSIRNSLGWRRYEHLHRAVAEALTRKENPRPA